MITTTYKLTITYDEKLCVFDTSIFYSCIFGINSQHSMLDFHQENIVLRNIYITSNIGKKYVIMRGKSLQL